MVVEPRRVIAALLLGAVFFVGVPACEVEQGEASPGVEWLERIAAAEELYCFEGVREVSARFGKHTSTKWYFETHRPGEAAVSVATGRPAGRQRRRRCFLPRLYWFKDRELLLKNYRVAIVGREKVAERFGVVLEIRAVRPGRPSVQMIADEETGLLMGMERRDYRGEVIFRSRYKTLLVDLPGEPDGSAPKDRQRRSRGPWGSWRKAKEPSAAEPFVPLVARHLPAGFERKVRKSGGGFGRGGHHELFSDGLCWLSMSQRPAEEGAEELVVEQRQWGDRVILEMVHCGIKVKVMAGLDPEELMETIRSLAPAIREEP